jgi:hypothetical protein
VEKEVVNNIGGEAENDLETNGNDRPRFREIENADILLYL